MKIENLPAPIELDKRFYPPFKITDDCPTCGKEAEVCNNRDAYLSYPWINKPEEITFYCGDCEDADRPPEWSKFIMIRITAEECESP